MAQLVEAKRQIVLELADAHRIITCWWENFWEHLHVAHFMSSAALSLYIKSKGIQSREENISKLFRQILRNAKM